jgi:hypothetical protein
MTLAKRSHANRPLFFLISAAQSPMHIDKFAQILILVGFSLTPACARGTISPSPPDFEALIPTTTDGPSTLFSTLFRQTGNLSWDRRCSMATSKILQATYTIPSRTNHPSTLLGAPHWSGDDLNHPRTSLMATSRILPTTNNRTLSTTTHTAALATTSVSIQPPTNDTESDIQSTKAIGSMLGLWVVVSLSVTVFLAWLGWEVWRDWGEMMWLERELRKPPLPWNEQRKLGAIA